MLVQIHIHENIWYNINEHILSNVLGIALQTLAKTNYLTVDLYRKKGVYPQEKLLPTDKEKKQKVPRKKTITDVDYADDIVILANTPNQAKTLLHSSGQAAAGIGFHVNAHKTEYICLNQTGDISTLDGSSLILVDKFTYLGTTVSST